ncbi:substrate-binding periplasmic protein [Terasakiella pusilla]|uniref:substrate-binding periplasmic protein n=1 Tax=Terasakiella pusilla TaxID=64973 RepID=UPI003AA9144D
MRFILALLSLFWSLSAQADQLKLDVCTSIYHMPPYYLTQGKTMPPKGQRGIFADALDETADKLDLRINWYRMPWSRCLSGLKSGQFGTVLGVNPSPEREKYLRFPKNLTNALDQERSMSPVHYNLFENANNPIKWAGDRRFLREKFKLGAPQGFIVTETLKSQGLPISETLSPYDGFSKLSAGQIDGFVFAGKVADGLIELVPDGTKQIRRLDPPIWTSYLYLPIQQDLYKAAPDLFETLWTHYAKNIRKRVEPHF